MQFTPKVQYKNLNLFSTSNWERVSHNLLITLLLSHHPPNSSSPIPATSVLVSQLTRTQPQALPCKSRYHFAVKDTSWHNFHKRFPEASTFPDKGYYWPLTVPSKQFGWDLPAIGKESLAVWYWLWHLHLGRRKRSWTNLLSCCL